MNDGPHSERQPLLESSKAQDAEEEKTLGSIYSHPNVSLMWVLLAAMFFTAIPISIPAPFFPKFAADECGLSPEEIGWCFSVFPLTSLIMSPIIPYMIGIMGRSNLLASAVALSAVSTVAFGLGTTLPTFLISRMVMGVACSAAMTCCTATLALVFNEHPGEVFGLVEMTFGGAFMIGPPIGGALYVFFGEFWAPFVFTTMPALVIIPLGKRMIRCVYK
ncbi:hypothetical protein SARC_09298 [Sphaeroforma arctica JP610]|uniref:Major facilitator superfamily (MFS) profile domain-containing protein n=1 Tax=Sphaeroforma arctica JP610 TaxID=667725 RepID=A0A0L0FNA0_9EUKA|nr:hypothetical protein SARC_09298 [Sphaeroforma arctica JP610]KNC78270.1 hypothetical protein SARC_09298 [Sphaeroforma arctica JP610]|eukprot:XP_014152172.1 hypothetical protein SARC_09298 [Sphaeroforma arctica JP610]